MTIPVTYFTSSIVVQADAAISIDLICSNSMEVIAVEGCTVEAADNYNEFANVDNETCVIWGCTLDWADNHNEIATHNDGSCVILLNESDYLLMDSLMNFSVNASYTIDSLDQLNQDLTEININLDSMNTSLSAELSSIEVITEQYDVILFAYSQLQNDFEECQPDLYGQIVIELEEGWNMIGYNLLITTAPEMQFSFIADDILVVKNNGGFVYWPEFDFNSIGELIPGQGYQIRMINSGTLIFE